MDDNSAQRVLALLEGSPNYVEGFCMKDNQVKVRLMGRAKDVEKVRKHLLKNHPQLILGKLRQGSNPKYANDQKWFSYGDYIIGKIRRRRS